MKGCQRVVITTASKRLQRAVNAVRAVHGLRKGSVANDHENRRLSYNSSPNLSPVRSPSDLGAKGTTGSKKGADLSKRKLDNGQSAPRGFNLNRRLSRELSSVRELHAVDERSDDGDDEYNEDEFTTATANEERGFAASVQVLRSISLWSGGCPTERSIQNAYIRLISSASHFIYIENQFFVSGLDGDHLCSNRIANALLERIRRAVANKENFRVMVVMPLLPAFQGKVEDKEASSLRGVMHWQYRSIFRGENSIYHQLSKEVEYPFEYLAFYGLRTHTFNDGQPETEQVYVHSKVMIVDDRSAIIGSANINERSMTGDRDSEIAVVVEDTDMHETVKLAGGTFTVGKFAHSFRMKLFEEHFGITPGTEQYTQYADPVQDDSWYSMQEQAMKNCQIYESVFACLPSDNVRSFKQISMYLENPVNANATPTSGNALRPGHRRTRMDSAAPVPSSLASTTPPMSPTGVPSPEPTPSKVADQQDAIHDDEVQIDASQLSPQPKANGSEAGSPTAAPSQEESVDASQPAKHPHALSHDHSRMLSGVIHLNLREDAQILKRKEELKEVQGHIVYFPLDFLADEPLEPKLLPADLFQ
jgi:phospholipase D1/2